MCWQSVVADRPDHPLRTPGVRALGLADVNEFAGDGQAEGREFRAPCPVAIWTRSWIVPRQGSGLVAPRADAQIGGVAARTPPAWRTSVASRNSDMTDEHQGCWGDTPQLGGPGRGGVARRPGRRRSIPSRNSDSKVGRWRCCAAQTPLRTTRRSGVLHGATPGSGAIRCMPRGRSGGRSAGVCAGNTGPRMGRFQRASPARRRIPDQKSEKRVSEDGTILNIGREAGGREGGWPKRTAGSKPLLPGRNERRDGTNPISGEPSSCLAEARPTFRGRSHSAGALMAARRRRNTLLRDRPGATADLTERTRFEGPRPFR